MPLFGAPNIARLEARGNTKALLKALEHEDPAIRSEAMRALGRLRCTDAVGPLISAMLDEQSENASLAAEVLGEIGDPAAVEALGLMLHRPPLARRQACVHALARIGTPEAVEALIAVFDREDTHLDRLLGPALAEAGLAYLDRLLDLLQSDDARRQAAGTGALQALGEPAIDALKVMTQDKESEAARRGVRGLAAIGTPTSLRALVPLLTTNSYVLRNDVQAALLAAGSAAVAPLAEAAIDGEPQQLRRAAIQALGAGGREEALAPLIEIAAQGPRPLARVATQALGQLHVEAASPALVTALASDDWLIRQHAAKGLAELWASPESTTALAAALYDDNSAVRKEALQALNALGWEPQTPPERVAVLAGRHEWEAITELGAPAIEPLSRLMPTFFSSDKSAAAAILAGLGEGAYDTLVELFESKDASVRVAAAEGLGRLGNRQAIPLLLAELERDDGNSGAAAAAALGELQAGEALDPLERAVLAKSGTVRTAAVSALTHFGKAGQTILLAASHAESLHVVRGTVPGLARLDDAQTRERLLDLVCDGRKEVQNDARRAAVELGQSILPQAAERLRRGEASQRPQMADLLGQLGLREAEPVLLWALWCDDLETRAAAARALEMLGTTPPSASLAPERIARVFTAVLARVAWSEAERRWFVGEALADLAAQNPQLAMLHTELAGEQERVCGTAAQVGPFGHNQISMVAWFKAWLLGQGATISAWDGCFYHREITVGDEEPVTAVILVYYEPCCN